MSPIFDSARTYSYLSLGTAVSTIVLKGLGYWLTGSVGLLADTLESFVNLASSLIAVWMLGIAMSPPDAKHPFGHFKFEYFSSAFTGLMIVIAAFSTFALAWEKLFYPQTLPSLDWGMLLVGLATALNAVVGVTLLRAGDRLNSITLRADGHHLLTDVWTSLGVLLGLGLVKITGWHWFDPVCAGLVGANIAVTGAKLLYETGLALTDTAIPKTELTIIEDILQTYRRNYGIDFHALRSRVAGRLRFISLHLLVPGDWSVQKGHDLCEAIELEIRRALPHSNLTIHLEPLEDPHSWADEPLERIS